MYLRGSSRDFALELFYSLFSLSRCDYGLIACKLSSMLLNLHCSIYYFGGSCVDVSHAMLTWFKRSCCFHLITKVLAIIEGWMIIQIMRA